MTPDSVTIDSSVFIAMWNGVEHAHKASRRFYEKVIRDEVMIHVPEIAIFEITNVLTRLGLREKSSAYLETFHRDGITVVPMSAELFGVFRGLAAKITLKTADLIVCATARLTQSTLVTWDKRLLQQASRVLTGIVPESL